ncbi:MAG TPA: ATP-binding cassette domain-containing protein [Flavisolibacter sp.]|nr:ATP-binding cassette domain-containing protein [Flavisolibacter sp.]
MKIELSNAGKRFNREWIFRNTSINFYSGKSYAITGPNGSGKSTLLQCIGGMIRLNEGSINAEGLYNYSALCAPYLDVVEEMKLKEFLEFHRQFKKIINNISNNDIIEIVGLSGAVDKEIRAFSSGMKQRVRLAQAIFSDVPVLLLDEPCSNLDQEGIEMYKMLIDKFCKDRILIISSNDFNEYSFCDEVFSMKNFKNNLVRPANH